MRRLRARLTSPSFAAVGRYSEKLAALIRCGATPPSSSALTTPSERAAASSQFDGYAAVRIGTSSVWPSTWNRRSGIVASPRPTASSASRPSDAPIDALIAATTRSALSVKVTQYGAVTGTPMYMAPEQWRGEEADARVDQFAFCVTLWESLHGARPFAGESLIELATAVHAGALQATPRVGVPAWLRRALVRGLSVDPERRFTSMEALLTALERGLLRGKRWRVGLGLGALGLAAALVPGWRAYDHARRVQRSIHGVIFSKVAAA